jgi:hypothetical protein
VSDETTDEIIRIPFNDTELHVVMIDRKPWMLFKHAMETLGLTYRSQLRTLKASSWAVVSHRETTAADGKRYKTTVVDRATFFFHLGQIDEWRVAESVRPRLRAYQAELPGVLEAYFTAGVAINPRFQQPAIESAKAEIVLPANFLEALEALVKSVKREQILAARVEAIIVESAPKVEAW